MAAPSHIINPPERNPAGPPGVDVDADFKARLRRQVRAALALHERGLEVEDAVKVAGALCRTEIYLPLDPGGGGRRRSRAAP